MLDSIGRMPITISYTLMTKCWHSEPTRRPSFERLRWHLRQLLKETVSRDGYINSRSSIFHAHAYMIPKNPEFFNPEIMSQKLKIPRFKVDR